jgi:hypothetical protein
MHARNVGARVQGLVASRLRDCLPDRVVAGTRRESLSQSDEHEWLQHLLTRLRLALRYTKSRQRK